MIKKNLRHLIISSILTLLPIAAGIILWDKLPDNMISHWDSSGTPDSVASKGFCVFGFPVLLLIFHFICLAITSADKKNNNQNSKMFLIVFYIMPVISFYASAIIYSTALGLEFEKSKFIFLLISAMFVIIGNFLPKCKQNSTLGIKLPWTIYDEENWNKTHRLGGKLWVICGIIMLVAVFLPIKAIPFILIPIIAVASVIPAIYSYVIYKKAINGGKSVIQINKRDKTIATITIIILAGLFIFAFILGSTGSINYKYNENSFYIHASYWSDITVEYSDIESIELLDNCEKGMRTNGYGGSKLLLGSFENTMLGDYTRYTFTSCKSCILLTIDGKPLVINASTDEETKELFDVINSKI